MEMLKALLDAGLTVGPRDPLMNTLYPGKYMVSAPYEKGHTQLSMMQADSIWCIVLDSLEDIIEAAFWMQGMDALIEGRAA